MWSAAKTEDDMSRAEVKAAGCAGKERFEGPEAARKVARRMNAKGVGVNAYRCQFCQGWHIGALYKGKRP
jgi:hypothetical protein